MQRTAISMWQLLLFLFHGSAVVSAVVQSVVVSLDRPKAVTSPNFLGVNIDAASLYQGTRLDFRDPQLRTLACRFGTVGDGPMTLRLGGSSADDLSTFVNNVEDGEIYLTADYWDDLIDFVETCGFNLAWDLNMRVGRYNDPRQKWNPQDAQRLLDHIKAKQQRVYAFQLGNEPGHYQTRNGGLPTADEHEQDFLTLAHILGSHYHGSADELPRMQGPDVCLGEGTNASPCANISYFRDILHVIGPDLLQDVTGHAYGLRGPKKGRAEPSQCNIESFLSVATFSHTVTSAVAAWKQVLDEMAPDANFVLSETASTADGGCPGLSNRFIAGFYFMEILGELGDMGVYQVYRQDLVGYGGINFASSYALFDPPGWYSTKSHGVLMPNPDYFTGLLYRKLVGPTRLPVKSNNPTNYIHAACAVGGGIVMTYINPSSELLHINFTIVLTKRSASVCRSMDRLGPGGTELYILTAPGGNLTSNKVRLNGKILNASSPLVGVSYSEENVTMPPYSYGFVVRRNAIS